MVFHCFFEQSGVFKNEFKNLGYAAYDYDILNDFNQTDFCVDLFNQIELAYSLKPSIFDNISCNDIIIAFFPCVRFSEQSILLYQCSAFQFKDYTDIKKISTSLSYHNELSFFYNIFCKLCFVCLSKNLKLIIENPYSTQHYLYRYFPIKPKVIDYDRTLRGDNFKKPTQFWFFNCEPKNNFIIEPLVYSKYKTIDTTHNKVERSLINKNYANRFIKEFILS